MDRPPQIFLAERKFQTSVVFWLEQVELIFNPAFNGKAQKRHAKRW